MNECFISLVLYHVIAFADMIQDEDTRNIMGWSMIAVVSVSLIANLGFLMIRSLILSFFKLRLFYWKCRYRRIRARLKARRQLEEEGDEPNQSELKPVEKQEPAMESISPLKLPVVEVKQRRNL